MCIDTLCIFVIFSLNSDADDNKNDNLKVEELDVRDVSFDIHM